MQVLSVNISNPQTINWRGKKVQTGIFKNPVDKPIFLGKNEVKGDTISDRKVHGGEYKACYLFSAEHYEYWKNLYPNLDWNYGMFGENLTLSGFSENKVCIGDIFVIGEAVVQITQPREPCYKFGVKFGAQKVLKQFIKYGYPGTYVRILNEGFVSKGDSIILREKSSSKITIHQFFNLLFAENKDQNLLKKAIQIDAIPERKREKLKAYLL